MKTTHPNHSKNYAALSVFFLALVLLLSSIGTGCGPTFNDETQSLLKKPEILSITTDPPEAAPGGIVKASVLVADQYGVMTDALAFWVPIEGFEEEGEGADVGELSEAEMAIAMAQMKLKTYDYSMLPKENYFFNDEGMASQMLSTLVWIGDPKEFDLMSLMRDFDALAENPNIRAGIRTVVVSTRKGRNKNPRITALAVREPGGDESSDVPLNFLRSYDDMKSSLRETAASSPYVAKEGSEITFVATVEDEGDIEENIRYQWISTGGDFGGFRESVQKWAVPAYSDIPVDPPQENEFRNDPNLHPVWLIVRDNRLIDNFGQSWAEFYVKVEKAD